ncbi:uncharacterized protein [Eurosta solidaginis]|uniref:uncharacterized protein n=1 Tax=Eurosta solidaginis TaxID=178769 RepID=UPI003530B82D
MYSRRHWRRLLKKRKRKLITIKNEEIPMNILKNNEIMQKKAPLLSEAPLPADLKNEMSALKDEVSECKSLLQQLINVQSKSNVLLESLLTQKETRCTFPIKTVDELYKTDEIVGQDSDLYMKFLNVSHYFNNLSTPNPSRTYYLKAF